MDIFSRQRVFSPLKLVVMGVLLALFLIVTVLVSVGKMGWYDTGLIKTAFAMHQGAITVILKLITHLSDTKVLAVFCLVLIALPWRFKFGIPVAVATGLGGVTHKIIKILVDRPRPETMDLFITVDGASFPSGHANGGLIFYALLAILIGRMLVMQNNKTGAVILRVGLAALILLIGFSRIYLGVHYPSDVLGGWLLGSLLTILFLTLYDHFWPKKFRISYEISNWDPIPKDAERRKGWKKPTKRSGEDRLNFPKKTGEWKYPGEKKTKRRNEEDAPVQRTRVPIYQDAQQGEEPREEAPVFQERPKRPPRNTGGKASPKKTRTPPPRPPRRPLV